MVADWVSTPFQHWFPVSPLPRPSAAAILLSVSVDLTTRRTSYKWNHAIFVLWWLAYSTQYNALKFHCVVNMCKNFLPTYDSPRMDRAHFVYSFSSWWTFGWLLPFGYCAQCYQEHRCIHICLSLCPHCYCVYTREWVLYPLKHLWQIWLSRTFIDAMQVGVCLPLSVPTSDNCSLCPWIGAHRWDPQPTPWVGPHSPQTRLLISLCHCLSQAGTSVDEPKHLTLQGHPGAWATPTAF